MGYLLDFSRERESPCLLVLGSGVWGCATLLSREIRRIITAKFYYYQIERGRLGCDYILLLIMRINICAILLVLLFAVFAQAAEPTKLTYFVEYEDEQEEDFIEVTVLVQSQSQQLTLAIAEAKKVGAQVQAIAKEYCRQYNKKGKGDCKDAVDVGTFEIEPKYQQVRKQNLFTAFVVSIEITINVFATDNIGYLVDSILNFQSLTLQGFEWKPLEEKDSEESAIKEGLEQGEGLCNQVGLSLGRIVDIEEVIDDAEEEEGGDEEEGEEEEEAPEVITYKFQVECVEKAKPKAK